MVGCCGRGLFGTAAGKPAEMDPAASRARGVSGAFLLGRLRCVLSGCCRRYLFDLGSARSTDHQQSLSSLPWLAVLLGRMPGCAVRSFAARDGGWASEAECRAWMGLQAGQQEGEAEQQLDPVSCLLFAHPSTGSAVYDCLGGLQAAFPKMLVAGEWTFGGSMGRKAHANAMFEGGWQQAEACAQYS